MTPFLKLKLRLAWDCIRQNELEPARREVNEALAAEGRHAPLLALLAEIALREGRDVDARALATEVLDEFGPQHVASGVLGKIALAAGKPADALPHLQDAYRLRPGAYTAEKVVDALEQLKRPDAAEQTLTTALETFPNENRLHRRAACFYERCGRREEALASLTELLRLDPGNEWARRKQIEIKSAERPPEAVSRLLSVGKRGSDPHLRGLYAKKLKAAGDFAGAAREFAEAARLEPNRPHWQKQAGFAYARARDDKEAIRLLRPLFLAEPQDRYVRNSLFAALKRDTGPEAVAAAINEALARHPDKLFLHGLRKKHAS